MAHVDTVQVFSQVQDVFLDPNPLKVVVSKDWLALGWRISIDEVEPGPVPLELA